MQLSGTLVFITTCLLLNVVDIVVGNAPFHKLTETHDSIMTATVSLMDNVTHQASLEPISMVPRNDNDENGGVKLFNQGRELQQNVSSTPFSAVFYVAIFRSTANFCMGWMPMMEFGCLDGGTLNVVSIDNRREGSNATVNCIEHPTLGPSHRQCQIEVDPEEFFGEITSVGATFSCSDAGRLAEAKLIGQDVECDSFSPSNSAFSAVLLAFFDPTNGNTFLVLQCLEGQPSISETNSVDGKPSACTTRDSCSGTAATTCNATLGTVHAIQDEETLNRILPIKTGLCTLCHDGLDFAADDDYIVAENGITCGQIATLLPSVFNATQPECLSSQADAQYVCGCPSLPPRNNMPENSTCTLCPNGEIPPLVNQTAILEIPVEPYRPITCEALDTYLGHIIEFGEGASYLESCTEFQQLDAVNCGCNVSDVPLFSPSASPSSAIEVTPMPSIDTTNVMTTMPPGPASIATNFGPSLFSFLSNAVSGIILLFVI